MVTEGNIHITLTQGIKTEVQIDSSRPLFISHYFAGKTTAEVMLLLGQMYQLCGVAHQYAFAQVLAKAGLRDISAEEAQHYAVLLAAETIKEHCVTMFTRWALQPDAKSITAMQTMISSYQQLLTVLLSDPRTFMICSTVDSKQVEAVLATFCQAANQLMLGGTHTTAVLENQKLFLQWLEHSQGVGGVFLQDLRTKGWQSLGAITPQHLPDLPDTIGDAMQDKAFVARPHYQKNFYETTPLSRQQHHELVQAVAAQHGYGVFTRAVAKMVEVAALEKVLQQGHEFVDMICYDRTMDAKLLTQVEAARGRLLHQVQLDQDKVSSYQILAPTEWNFHPHGVVVQMLASLPNNNKTIMQEQVALLVNAVDPCVGYTLEVCDA